MINLGNIGAVRSAVVRHTACSLPHQSIRSKSASSPERPIPGADRRTLGNAADSTRYLPLYDLVVMNEGRNVSEWWRRSRTNSLRASGRKESVKRRKASALLAFCFSLGSHTGCGPSRRRSIRPSRTRKQFGSVGIVMITHHRRTL